MEQGRVRRYSRRERQGMTDREYGTQDAQYEPMNSTKSERADCREDAKETAGSGRRFAYAGSGYERDYTSRTSNSCCSEKFDSGLKAAWDYVSNSRIQVKKNGRTVAKVPVSLGLVGVVGGIFNRRLAWVGAIGLAGALSKGYSLNLDLKKPH